MSDSHRNGSTAGTSSRRSPRFMQVLKRIAEGSPLPAMKIMAERIINQLEETYHKGLQIITSASQGAEDTQRQAAKNIISFSNDCEVVLRMTGSVGIPFFDEEWCSKYWVPITDLCVDNYAIELASKVALKVDWNHISAECKVEVLSMLGNRLAAGFLTPNNADEVMNLIFMTMFGDNPDMAETRSTRRATVKMALQSQLPETLLRYIAVPSPNRSPVQAEDVVKKDCVFFLGLILAVVLGEMRVDLAEKHAPHLFTAIQEAGSGIWDELQRLSDGLTFIPGSDDLGEARLFHLISAALSLGVLSSPDRAATGAASHEAVAANLMVKFASRIQMPVEQRAFMKQFAEQIFRASLPLGKKDAEWFAGAAEQLGENACPLARLSDRRRAQATVGVLPQMSREEALKYNKIVMDDQVNRGLLDSDQKPVVQDLTAGKVATSAERACAECGLEARTNINLKLMRCGGCAKVYYCTQRCQKQHWKRHRAECKATQAARASGQE